MTDEIDRANEEAQAFVDHALDEVRAPAHAPQGASLSHCEDCGVEIPAARRAATQGCTRCVLCQRAYEDFLKSYRRGAR